MPPLNTPRRTQSTNSDWQFWLFIGAWAILVVLTLLRGGAFLGWVEDTLIRPFGLIRSPTSPVPSGSIGALCFAWLALDLFVFACANLRAVGANQPGHAIPPPPRFLTHWLDQAERSPRGSRIIGWCIGLLPIIASLYIARVIFT
jgi:hypothetical protein